MITDDQLNEAARALIPMLDHLAGKVVTLPPPPAPQSQHPCGSPRCSVPGSLNRVILGPEEKIVEARLLLCAVHRHKLEQILAEGSEPWKIQGRPILALNPEVIRLGTVDR